MDHLNTEYQIEQDYEQDTGPRAREIMRERLIGEKAQNALRFQTIAVKHFGPAAGIFCRQLLFWDGKGQDPGGWIYKSIEEWQAETGLSRRQQEAARNRLKGSGKGGGKPVLEEKRGIGPDGRWRLFYRLNLEALMERLGENLKPPEEFDKPSTSAQGCSLNRAGTMPTLVNRDHAQLSGPTIQKSTQKTTTDNNNKGESNVRSMNDVTSRCLLMLSRVKGFPADQTENAVYLAKLREEFPDVDAEEICRNYEIWHMDNPGKTKNFRGCLRNFFDKASRSGSKPASATVSATAGKSSIKTPAAAVEALRAHQELSRYAYLATGFDFTSEEHPPNPVYMQMGGTWDECGRVLIRVRSVCQNAVREADGHGVEGWRRAQEEAQRREEQHKQEEERRKQEEEQRKQARDEAVEAVISDQESNAGRLFEAAVAGRSTRNGPLSCEDISDALVEELGEEWGDSHIESVRSLLRERGASGVPLISRTKA